MIVQALAFAAILWIGSWLIAVLLKDTNDRAKLAIVAGFSVIPTWLAVQQELAQPYLMSAITIPIVFLMYRHVRGQALIRAHIKQNSRQNQRR